MFFVIKNNRFMSADQLRTSTLLKAYYIIEKYPLHASDIVLDQYLQQQYKSSLKNISIKLLLKSTFYKDTSGGLVLMFKDPKDDKLAQLVTYGNGAIPGSSILQVALK